jgi:hypothetical protein
MIWHEGLSNPEFQQAGQVLNYYAVEDVKSFRDAPNGTSGAINYIYAEFLRRYLLILET